MVGSGRTKLWRRELCSAGVLGKTKQGKEGVRAVMNIFHFVWAAYGKQRPGKRKVMLRFGSLCTSEMDGFWAHLCIN